MWPSGDQRLLCDDALPAPVAVHSVTGTDLVVLYRIEDYDPSDGENDLVVLGIFHAAELRAGAATAPRWSRRARARSLDAKLASLVDP